MFVEVCGVFEAPLCLVVVCALCRGPAGLTVPVSSISRGNTIVEKKVQHTRFQVPYRLRQQSFQCVRWPGTCR